VRSSLLDSFRFTAIVLLLAAHTAQEIGSPLGGYFGIKDFYHVSLGGIAVTIFLFVSGAGLELMQRNAGYGYRQYIMKRLLRIYPVYYICLLGVIVCAVLISWLDAGTISPHFPQFQKSEIILLMTGFYAYAGRWGGPFLVTSWFIGLIMTLYLIYPFLGKMIRRSPHPAIIIILLTSVMVRLILGRYDILPNRPLDWFPLCRVFEFSLGIYFVTIVRRSALFILNGRCPAWMQKGMQYVNEISFPLFLLHYPLLYLIPAFTSRGIDPASSIAMYVTASCLLSRFVYTLDRKIPREAIMNCLGNLFPVSRQQSSESVI